jgi:hypothetical protein
MRTPIATSLAILLSLGNAAATPLKATFTMDGKSLKLTHAAAFRERSTSDPYQKETYVVLSQKALDIAALGKVASPYASALNDPAIFDSDHISLWIDAAGNVRINASVGGTQHLDTSSGIKIMRQPGSLSASCNKNTEREIACAINSKAGAKLALDLAFDVPVNTRAVLKTLVAGGGEVGAGLNVLYAAITAKDHARMLVHLDEQARSRLIYDVSTPNEFSEELIKEFAFLLPKKAKITGGVIFDAARAQLDVEGEMFESRFLFLVQMTKRDGQWRFRTADRVGYLK